MDTENVIVKGADLNSNGKQATAEVASNRLWTIPNIICIGRFFGSLVLIPIAYYQLETAFIAMVGLLFASDWIDGKLAVWLNQRTVIGARIDSVADATYYAMSGLCILWLKWSQMRALAIWIAAAIGTYLLTCGIALVKYRRLPSYHTYAAKACNWLMIAGLVIWFVWNQQFPLQFALTCVALANIETILMTWMLPVWLSDVHSLWHARIRIAAGGLNPP